MTILEIIRKRRSVRTFDSRALNQEDTKRILEFAAQAENPFSLPIEWKILNAKEHSLSSPVIVGTNTYIAGKMKRAPHAEEAFGFSFERIVLFLEENGIGTTWIAGTMNRPNFERAMEVADGEVMPCVSPLGYPAPKMSVRESMMRKGIRADSRYAFGSLFFDGGFEMPLTEEKAGKLKDAFEAVRWAPSAVNKQPWRLVLDGQRVHFYEKRDKGYFSNGWDIQKIDLGIALCHFELAAKESGFAPTPEIADPGIPTGEEMQYIASYIIK